jgi:hypothetical protein
MKKETVAVYGAMMALVGVYTGLHDGWNSINTTFAVLPAIVVGAIYLYAFDRAPHKSASVEDSDFVLSPVMMKKLSEPLTKSKKMSLTAKSFLVLACLWAAGNLYSIALSSSRARLTDLLLTFAPLIAWEIVHLNKILRHRAQAGSESAVLGQPALRISPVANKSIGEDTDPMLMRRMMRLEEEIDALRDEVVKLRRGE